MKYLLVLILVLTAYVAKPCGWSSENDAYYFYNLFKQTSISSRAYYPFLREDGVLFHNTEEASKVLPNVSNLSLWRKLLNSWHLKEINTALLSDGDDFKKCWKGRNSTIDRSAKKYMLFAKKCSRHFEYRYQPSWKYDDILKSNKVDASTLLEEAMSNMNRESDKQLKLRYSYQIIRILHYSKQYKEAISFFEKKLEGKVEKNEMYYYLLDQVAGCYYSLGNYEKAAYLFLKVFSNSIDRKKSAFLSYRFCTNKGAEGKTLFDGVEDETSFILLKSLRSFSDDTDGLNELFKIAPYDDKLELLFMRSLNNVERRVWPTHIGMDSEILPLLEAEDLQKIDELYALANKIHASPPVFNKDFWKISASYLSFLKGDFQEAKQSLSQVRSSSFKEQKYILTHTYAVFSWQKMDAEKENYLTENIANVLSKKPLEWWADPSPAWKYVILDQVAHLYYKNNQLSKAFLIHNRIEAVDKISSLPLIDDLLAFVQKENKNQFEQLLEQRTAGIRNTYPADDYLNYVKGLYFLQKAAPKIAHMYLEKSSLSKTKNRADRNNAKIEDLVSAKIFSNNTKECDDNCSEEAIMLDSVYMASLFSFIKPQFSKADLALYLIELDTLSKNETQWKAKLAHYLLGNYYYNLSNTGYYRGTLAGKSNCCWNQYFTDNRVANDMIEQNSGYNLYDVANYEKIDYNFITKAMDAYQQVISSSKDKELNARCLYMMAKCELNIYYNTTDESFDWKGYDGTVSAEAKAYKKSFGLLKNDYRDTKFYDMIIEECSFFRYYCAL